MPLRVQKRDMMMQRASETVGGTAIAAIHEVTKDEGPVREYISALALELAQLARRGEDEALARLLESAASLAGEPLARDVSGHSSGPRAV